MAEIKIEKKKPIWPWILLILIILIGVYIFWQNYDTMNDPNDTEMVTDTIEEINEDYNEVPVDVDTITMEIDTTAIQ